MNQLYSKSVLKNPIAFLLIFFCNIGFSQMIIANNTAEINFDDYEELLKEVKVVREKRLVDFNTFLDYQKDENTVVLDTRSRKNFNAIHIKGAINLPFTEFTTVNLRMLIPDPNTRILIYCNNNIQGDPIYFGSKTYSPEDNKKRKAYNKKATFVDKNTATHNSKTISLALNIPTYIHLYGYGYRNIYELNEIVSINDERVKFKKKKK